MKLLFLHGWKSVVGGVKPTYLQQQGHEIFNPKLDDEDFAKAVTVAQQVFDLQRPDVVVGSSRGGAVAMNISSEGVPLVLLCPAWKKYGHVQRIKSASLLLHSRHDEVIPYADSEELLVNSHLPPDAMIEVGTDHRLVDDNSLAVMLWACEHIASLNFTPWSAEPRPSLDYQGEGSYVCDSCGESIVIPLDLTAGPQQHYVEDCPVCCHANVIHVSVDETGDVEVWGQSEVDRN